MKYLRLSKCYFVEFNYPAGVWQISEEAAELVCVASVFEVVIRRLRRLHRFKLGNGQYHLAVAGGCEGDLTINFELRTHPLPRGGTDRFQV
jgi:hypothetical protein